MVFRRHRHLVLAKLVVEKMTFYNSLDICLVFPVQKYYCPTMWSLNILIDVPNIVMTISLWQLVIIVHHENNTLRSNLSEMSNVCINDRSSASFWICFQYTHIFHAKFLYVHFLLQSEFRHELVLGLFPVYWETYFTTMKDEIVIFIGRVGGFSVAI